MEEQIPLSRLDHLERNVREIEEERMLLRALVGTTKVKAKRNRRKSGKRNADKKNCNSVEKATNSDAHSENIQ